MNHGQFNRTCELVAAVHTDGGGIHPGVRAAHAFGRVYTGTFSAAARVQIPLKQDSSSSIPIARTREWPGIAGHSTSLA
jgi:hypothetical protein